MSLHWRKCTYQVCSSSTRKREANQDILLGGNSPVTPTGPMQHLTATAHERRTSVATRFFNAARMTHPPLAAQRVAKQPRLPSLPRRPGAASAAPRGVFEVPSGRDIATFTVVLNYCCCVPRGHGSIQRWPWHVAAAAVVVLYHRCCPWPARGHGLERVETARAVACRISDPSRTIPSITFSPHGDIRRGRAFRRWQFTTCMAKAGVRCFLLLLLPLLLLV